MTTAAFCAPPAALTATGKSWSPIDTTPWLQADRRPDFTLDGDDIESDPETARGKGQSKRALPKRKTKGRGRKVSPSEHSNDDDEDMDDIEAASTSKKSPSKSAASRERRRLQNRVAQRSLRARKEAYLQQLEQKLQEQEEELLILRTENMKLKQETARAAHATRHSASSSNASYPSTDSSTDAYPPSLAWHSFAQPGKAPTPGPYVWTNDLSSAFENAAWQTNLMPSPLPLPTDPAHLVPQDSSMSSGFNLTLPPQIIWPQQDA